MFRSSTVRTVISGDDVGLGLEATLLLIKAAVENLNPATDFEGGPVTVGTTAVEITFTGTPMAVFIQADHDNAGAIYIGKSNVTNAGGNAVMRLDGAEGTGWNYVDTTNPIYVVASQASQKIYKVALLA